YVKFFFSSRRRHTSFSRDWSSDVCSSDLSQQKYPRAYEAYQLAVYRDPRNPTFWCSIGVLSYQINQYRDALDAYSRAIRLNPYRSEERRVGRELIAAGYVVDKSGSHIPFF